MPQRVPALAGRPAPGARAGWRLSGPDDTYEREADRVTGAVTGNGSWIPRAVARAGPPPQPPAPGSYFEPRPAQSQAPASIPPIPPIPPIVAAVPAGAGPVVQRSPAEPGSGPLPSWLERLGRGGAPPEPALPEAIPEDACGTAWRGMPPEEQTRLLECTLHARYVNVLNQAAANMSRMGAPYAPGLAAIYRTMVGEIVGAGVDTRPTAATQETYAATNLQVTVSRGVTLPVPLFELVLVHEPNGPNGAHHGRGIELNEVSHSMVQKDYADVERTLYHEGFHFLSWLVRQHNDGVREGRVPGEEVSPQLDDDLVLGFEGEFRAAVEPIWQRALSSLPTKRQDLTPQDLSSFQWSKVYNEILSQLEEEIYAYMQESLKFSRKRDLPAWRQVWLHEPGYWDAGIVFDTDDMQWFLESLARAEIETQVLPLVQRIQLAYLEQRPRR